MRRLLLNPLPPRLAAVLAGIACGAALAPSATAQPVLYRLDPQHSFVHFEVMHFGTSTLRGRFGPIDGGVWFDAAARQGELGIRIATAGVDTGVKPLDARLRQPDLFATEAHPEAWFVARQFRYDGDRLAEVRGELTLRGQSRPLGLTALRFGCRDDARLQRQVCGGDFEAQLKRSDFDMSFGLPLVGDDVRLVVQVEGIRDDDARR